ncbi:hypothetical protein SCLCIDRAFT_27594 [Scleroderma citrinum Foug A]|uniref:Ricin B lectin domain-containing protein n=1 Tax=Scleroderma citrinum Foug A TaxID=1036808 RepID=A0A0C3A2V7_9AGAM|nr:hypothetical protein SCLCIDRAFT_27594 [Scleroderma citrinum Foug A]
MSSTLQTSSVYYILTSNIYVGVNSNSQVMVDNTLKTKFTFNYNSKADTYTIGSGENFVALDTASPPHVIVGGNAQSWVINPVNGDLNTYTISPVGQTDRSWCDPISNPRQIYIQTGVDPTQADRQFLLSAI